MISVPAITNNPSWIYSMEYNCFSLPVSDFGINHSPILEQIDIHIPSLPEDISAEYRSVENSSAPTNLFNDLTFSQNLSMLSQNVYCDAIVSTIRTELLVQQYLDDIKVIVPLSYHPHNCNRMK